MTIQKGQSLPNFSLKIMGSEGIQEINEKLLSNKKIVLFAVPGAFTPGCSKTHLPGFIEHAKALKAKGVDEIICTSVNDVFVMDAWGKAQAADNIIMAADGNADFTKALGLELDGSGFGMGIRSKRYAMIVNNGVIEYLGIDDKGIDASSAETVLANL